MFWIRSKKNSFLLHQAAERTTADPGDARSIPARSHTFVEIDHEIIYMVILLLPLIQEGLCQLLGNRLAKLAQDKVW